LTNKSSVLKNIPAFTHLTKNALVKLTFSMIEHNIGKGTSLFKEGENIKGLYLIKEGNFEISRKFKRDLKERYNGHALPVQIRRNIKCFVASNNEALGLEYILGYSDTHDFSSL
jgi:signal-transduction protein with cAMP-binding, CBS, and nucleotidyltransferase domain